jgi:hypothetical protein
MFFQNKFDKRIAQRFLRALNAPVNGSGFHIHRINYWTIQFNLSIFEPPRHLYLLSAPTASNKLKIQN